MIILGFSESDNGGYLISSDSIETPRRSALIFVWFDRIFNVSKACCDLGFAGSDSSDGLNNLIQH